MNWPAEPRTHNHCGSRAYGKDDGKREVEQEIWREGLGGIKPRHGRKNLEGVPVAGNPKWERDKEGEREQGKARRLREAPAA